MDPVSLIRADTKSEAPEPRHSKALKAGAQFEAVLLNNVLGAIERAFTKLPGHTDDHSTEAYSGLAMQTLASKLADGGGIGLGRLLTTSLENHSVSPSKKQATKSLKLSNGLPMGKLQGQEMGEMSDENQLKPGISLSGVRFDEKQECPAFVE